MVQFLMISFSCTVLYTEVLKNRLTIILLTWQVGNSIDIDDSNPLLTRTVFRFPSEFELRGFYQIFVSSDDFSSLVAMAT